MDSSVAYHSYTDIIKMNKCITPTRREIKVCNGGEFIIRKILVEGILLVKIYHGGEFLFRGDFLFGRTLIRKIL